MKVDITPSHTTMWRGTNIGQALTLEQTRKAAVMSREMERRHKQFDLPSRYTVVMWTEPKTLQEIAREVRFECPVISCTRDRKRLRVITPSGLETWVEWNL